MSNAIFTSRYLDDCVVGAWRTARLRFLVDGHPFVTTDCDKHRPDMQAANKGTDQVGFEVLLPPGVLDGYKGMMVDQ